MAPVMETAAPAAFTPDQAGHVGTAVVTPSWDLATERRVDDGKTLATALGWFSIGLGVLELVAPDELCDWLGVPDHSALVQLYGLREIGTGIGVLSQRRPVGWIQARIAGDMLDLGTLTAALPRSRRQGNVLTAMAMVAGVTMLDIMCAKQLGSPRRQPSEQTLSGRTAQLHETGEIR